MMKLKVNFAVLIQVLKNNSVLEPDGLNAELLVDEMSMEVD